MSTDGPSFADLFAQESMPAGRAKRVSVGDEVKAVVAHITTDAVFVDLDAKQQGFFDRFDLTGPDGELQAKVGDTISGWVVHIDPTSHQVKLGSRLGKDAGRDQLQTAFEGGLPVEGEVTGLNKGGAEVTIAGLRGFCPMSQLDARYVEDPGAFVGRTLSFVITKLDERDVVLSRRKLLEREASEARTKVLSKLQVGAELSGQVTQTRDFGAFVDLGGVEGLIPMRELSHDRVQRADDIVSVGDVVHVKVTKIEPDSDKDRVRITLSLKALAADPWEGVETIAPVGRVVAGQVTRIAEFGAFVRLGTGIEGLLHVSELSVKHPSEALEVGQQLMLAVRGIDQTRRRISLALAADGAALGEAVKDLRPVVGALVDAVVEKHERFGVFVQIDGTKGRVGRGLIPHAESGFPRGADMRKEMPEGSNVRAKVIDATEGRVRLSIKAAKDDAERAVYDNFKQAQAAQGGMGTLGDLLSKALDKK
ncbi:MAG: S1 RNA-binding domain-containing protein [Sandaracinaceae bacterium]